LYGWLQLEPPKAGDEEPPGFCHFPQYDDEYFRQLTAEQLIAQRSRKGFVRLEWEVIPGRENHVLDARVYARAAAALTGLDRFRDSDWDALEAAAGRRAPVVPVSSAPIVHGTTAPLPPAATNPPARKSPWLGQRRGGWLRGGR
jgi:phage terminase large subunit GpA-like protein